MKVKHLSWHNCYSEGWQGEIVPEAFSHPAKYSRGLIRRIYAYALEQGYLKPGDWVADPFAGVGLGAADALANGLNWFGSELEQNFIDMGAGCDCTGISKADWVRYFGRWKRFALDRLDGRHWCPRCLAEAGGVIEPRPPTLPGMERQPTASYERNSGKIPFTRPHRYAGNLDLFARHARGGATAVLVQGDSRRLVEVLEGARAEGIIASPPFQGSIGDAASATERKTIRPSLPNSQDVADYLREKRLEKGLTRKEVDNYLGTVTLYSWYEGRPAGIQIPTPKHWRGLKELLGLDNRFDKGILTEVEVEATSKHTTGKTGHSKMGDYGTSPAQLGNMPTGEPPSAVISSPPYANRRPEASGSGVNLEKQYQTYQAQGGGASFEKFCRTQKAHSQNYGTSEGQLGMMPTGEPPQAILSSPPYTGDGVGHDAGHPRLDATEDARRGAEGCGRRPAYGASNGQLAAMREGDAPTDYTYTPGSLTPTQFDARAVTESATFATAPRREEAVECEWEEEGVDAVIASPPFASTLGKGGETKGFHSYDKDEAYNRCKRDYIIPDSDGQLAALPEGEPPQVDGIVASPPYIDSVNSGFSGIDWEKGNEARPQWQQSTKSPIADYEFKYGDAEGQMGAMKEGEPPAGIVQVGACISSPPIMNSDNRNPRPPFAHKFHGNQTYCDESPTDGKIGGDRNSEAARRLRMERIKQVANLGNIVIDGNKDLINTDTFWSAAKTILLQCHAVLAPGGVAIFVCKRFVRDKKIVEFSQQWADLCQSCGFELIEWIRAWLVEERGTQYDLEGEAHTKTVKRFSFFRRLHAQKYPHLAIEWEDVLIFRKSAKERKG